MRRRGGRCWRSTTRPSADGGARERIAYGDLGVEQLGTVYETLLDYEPIVRRRTGARPPAAQHDVLLDRGSGVRKATGTFYTPLPIADYVVRRTLGPLVRDAPPEQILALRIVDPAMGSGAFLVAACRYLARAYEASLVQSGGCHPSDIGEHERAAIRRTIAERCLYGVDLNPMAVQLARLSLWLATLSADRPLTFLDHRLQTGDSLLGAWLSTLARPPGHRRRGVPARLCDPSAVRRRRRSGTHSRPRCRSGFRWNRFRTTRSKTFGPRNRRSRRLNRRDTGLSRWKQVADLWCACWLAPAGGRITAGGVQRADGRHRVGHRRAAVCRRGSLSGSGARGGPRAASLPLGARVPGSVLRRGRPPSRERAASTPSSATRRGT